MSCQPVRIFVQPALPGLMRMHEEAVRLKSACGLLMQGGLLAAAAGERMNLGLTGKKRGTASACLTLSARLSGAGAGTLKRVFRSAEAAGHRIRLPAANPGTFFNDAGAMICRNPVFNLAPPVRAAMTFSSLLPAAQTEMQDSSLPLVPGQYADRFVRD